MPESSFFEPMSIGGIVSPPKPKYVQTPQVTAGYGNVYGTRLAVGGDPVTQQTYLNTQIPIGSHRNQLFFQASAYGQPGQNKESPYDVGAYLGVTKKIAPKSLSESSAQRLALQEAAGGQLDNSFTAEFLNRLNPEQRALLGSRANEIRNDATDRALGIVPGATKYGFGAGVDFGSSQVDESGAVINPRLFAKDFATRVQSGNFNAFADPNRQSGPGTPGINPDAEPGIDPYTGQAIVKRQSILN